jgi:Ser/Thr protein kinase RdoA (MazF antagonist)
MIDAAATLLTDCRRLIDPHARFITTHAGHDGTLAVRAATDHGDVIVKRHRGADRHQQEVHAYTHWTAALREQAPRLLAATTDPPTIVITAVPGRPLANTSLPPLLEAMAHQQAGTILRDLHNAAPARTDPDMTGWLAERGEYWLARARQLMPSSQRAEIRAHLRALQDLCPIPAVPCHLDYTLRNLLCAVDGNLGSVVNGTIGTPPDLTTSVNIAAIDFEHARYDLAARDLVRLANRVWKNRPDLKEAFLQGYGALTSVDLQVIEHCSYLDTLTGTVRTAQRHPNA